MPLYEYLCESCGRRSEILQKIDESPATECPHCGGPLRKLFSAPAFHFKGSGWYVSDYARAGGKGEEAKDAGGKGGEAKEAGGKPEEGAKPDAAASKKDAEPNKADAAAATAPPAKPPAD